MLACLLDCLTHDITSPRAPVRAKNCLKLSSDWDWAWAWDWGLGIGMGKKNYQVDSNNNNLGESNMFKEKIINNH